MATATYEAIATYTAPSAQASYTFTSIPSTYTDLVLVCNIKSSAATSRTLYATYNSDTGSNYSMTRIFGDGSSAASSRTTNQTGIDIGYFPGANGTGFGTVNFSIQNYSNSTTYKTGLYRWGSEAAGSGLRYVAAGVGLWRSTSAITSISLAFDSAGDIATDSTLTLYGIKAA
jgi:hypothetical protein